MSLKKNYDCFLKEKLPFGKLSLTAKTIAKPNTDRPTTM